MPPENPSPLHPGAVGCHSGPRHAGTGLTIKLAESLDRMLTHGRAGGASFLPGAYTLDAGPARPRDGNARHDPSPCRMPTPEPRVSLRPAPKKGPGWRARIRSLTRQERVSVPIFHATANATPGLARVATCPTRDFGEAGSLLAPGPVVPLTIRLDKGYHGQQPEGVSGREIQTAGRSFGPTLKGCL